VPGGATPLTVTSPGPARVVGLTVKVQTISLDSESSPESAPAEAGPAVSNNPAATMPTATAAAMILRTLTLPLPSPSADLGLCAHELEEQSRTAPARMSTLRTGAFRRLRADDPTG
jgi:hypothetical protein